MPVSIRSRRHGEPDLTDPDNPEIPSAAFAHAVPVANDAEGRGDLHAAMLESERRYRGQQKTPTKVSITIRLERDAVAAYRATGRGWQTRLSDDLAALVRRRSARTSKRRTSKRGRSRVSK
jgi:uncharacterized protein (DUF4415 family)